MGRCGGKVALRDWKSLEKLFEFRIHAKAWNLLGKAFDRFLHHGFPKNFPCLARPHSCCQRVTNDTPGLCSNYLWSAGTCEKGNKLNRFSVYVYSFSTDRGKRAEAGRVEITASYSRRRKSPNENFHISLNLNYFDSFPSRRHRLNAYAGTALSDVYRLKPLAARTALALSHMQAPVQVQADQADVNLKANAQRHLSTALSHVRLHETGG